MNIWEKVFGSHHGGHHNNGGHRRESSRAHHNAQVAEHGRNSDGHWERPRVSVWSAPTGRTCARCSTSSPMDARFCNGCGAPFSPSACGKCNGALQAGTRFCGQCGNPVP
ncbi:zinc ribbon domain-containing protein [Paraburkholderia sp. LEh10]|nr:zinc ribbon domain-containing protein [Paraburkholderia sp. LEh10]